MFYIGLMSGTSVDGIDAVVVSIPTENKLSIKATHHDPFKAELREQIHSLIQAGDCEPGRINELDVALGECFAGAANDVLKLAGLDKKAIRAIGSHGQTLYHHPNARNPFSLQVGKPSIIAELTGITTVADFRARDIAGGGQGAPLAPAFHQWMFHSPKHDRVIINIGGITNISYLPKDKRQPVIGFDTGPGNTLLDQWVGRHLGQTHDEDGRWAASGKPSQNLLERLLADPYFHAAPPKSTGREHFNLAWLDEHLKHVSPMPPAEDVQATLLQLTVRSIAAAIQNHLPQVSEAYVCGGGSHNREMMTALAHKLSPASLATTERLGIPPDWVEAAAFAWLAHQTLEGKPGNLPSVTGARHPVVLGEIYKA